MTVSEALRESGIEAREARILLSAASGLPEACVIANPGRALASLEEKFYFESVARRKAGEPVAYILGRKEFYGLELEVNPAVLVPRPETELLVDLALDGSFASACDLGTGSGAIALALKDARRKARVLAVDASAAALEVARRNAVRHGLAVEFREGGWLAPLGMEMFDLIVANPPYVAEGDPHLPALRFEPRAALVSGPDGLDDIRAIAARAADHLEGGGRLLIEHGQGQDAEVRRLLEEAGLESVRTWPDLAGIPRVTGGTR